MKMTLLPDFEAKKQRKNQRKKKKSEKNMRKRRRMQYRILHQKQTFGRTFAKRLIWVMVFAFSMSAIGTFALYKNGVLAATKEYTIWKNNLTSATEIAIHRLNNDEYLYGDVKQKLFANAVRFAMLEGNNCDYYDFSAAMYDVTEFIHYEDYQNPNISIVCDSGLGVSIMVAQRGNNGDIRYLDSDIEDYGVWSKQVIESGKAKNGHPNTSVEVFPVSGYVNDTSFIPGELYIAYYDKDDNRLADSPGTQIVNGGTRQGYQAISFDGPVDEGYWCILQVGGTKEDSDAKKYTNAAKMWKDQNGYCISHGPFDDEALMNTTLDDTCMDSVLMEWPAQAKHYDMVTAGVYHFWGQYGNMLWYAYAGILIGCLFVAYIMAKLRYAKVQARQEIDLYRKNLTDSMAHDLKSPLMAISAMAENLSDNVHTEKKDYYAKAILENVTYMNTIIENSLNLSKTEHAGLKLAFKETDIGSLMEQILSKYEIETRETDKEGDSRTIRFMDKTIYLKQECTHNLKLDPVWMQHALENLVANAVKFTPDQGEIMITDSNQEIKITNTCSEKDSVSDKEVEALMQPFVKGDESRSNKSGSGLGLAIANNICSLHGYKLSIEYNEQRFIAKIRV